MSLDVEIDCFDIAETLYCFLSENYNGMDSDGYAQLCRLDKVFRPRPSLRGCPDEFQWLYDEMCEDGDLVEACLQRVENYKSEGETA